MDSLPVIMSIVGGISIPIIVVWLRYLVRRVFHGIDISLQQTHDNISEIKNDFKKLNDDVVELRQLKSMVCTAQNEIKDLTKTVNSISLVGLRLEIQKEFLLKNDFNRQYEFIANQIESMQPKIDQVDQKIENIRNHRR